MAWALVTGATAGIGAAFARELASRGNDIVLVARDASRLEGVAAELVRDFGVETEVLPADLSVRDDLDRVAARLGEQGRPIDVLVNNAGFGVHATLLDEDVTDHIKAMDVMCLAVLVLGGAAARAMVPRGRGRIITVASLAAWITQGGYSPVKAYALSYSQGLSNELHGTGVTATCLCPGWVRTEFHERAGISTGSIPDVVWVDAARVARETVDDAERGKVISIPTTRWKIARFLLQHSPDALVRLVSRMLTNSRRKNPGE